MSASGSTKFRNRSVGGESMINEINRKLSGGARFCILAALASALVVLTLPSSAAAQTCSGTPATWTTTVPVNSPPVLFSFAPFAHAPQSPEVWTFTNMFTNQPWATVLTYSNT